MAEYDFTIRATDNRGAYSDRTFTIEVRNTNVERYVVLASNGAYHSPTGLPGTWKQESNVIARALAYGDGKWVAYGTQFPQSADVNQSFFVSSDATNWTRNDMSVNWGAFLTSRSAAAIAEIQTIKYVNGTWIMFASVRNSYNSTTYYTCCEFTSTDLKSWSWVRIFGSDITSANYSWREGVFDFDYNPVTTQWVAVASSFVSGTSTSTRLHQRLDTTNGWGAPVFTASNASSSDYIRPYTVNILNLNGQWAVNLGGIDTLGVAISTNGIDWVRKPINDGTATSSNLIYSNGYLIRCSRPATGSGSSYISRSKNGGRDWALGGSVTGGTQTYTIGKNSTAYGNIIVHCGGASGTISVSTNSGTSFSNQVIAGTATMFAVLARPD